MTPGTRDDWLRIHWLRDGFELLIGGPSWPLHDFRHLVRGRLGNPTAPDVGVIEFPIEDMSNLIKQPSSKLRFASGPYAGEFKPVLLGFVRGQIEPPLTDTVNLEYTINSTAILSLMNTDTNNWDGQVYDNQVPITTTGTRSVSAVNTGTGEITDTASHGMVDDYRVRFTTGTPPLGLALDTNYYAVGVTPGTDKFKLALTVGGAPITGGAGTTGATYQGYGYRFDTAAGTMQLAASPVGRVTIAGAAVNNSVWGPSQMLDQFLFTNYLQVSLNHKDPATFTALAIADITDTVTAGIWSPPAKTIGKDLLNAIFAGTRTWGGFTPDGIFQIGALKLPAGPAVRTFDVSNVRAGSLRLTGVIRPVDFENAQVSYAPFYFTGGPMNLPGQPQVRERSILTYTYGAPGVPLDEHPDQWDADETAIIDTILENTTGLTNRYVSFGKYWLGLFEFETTLPGMEVSIGDTISLDFPRLGWKEFSAADPASPDNTATIDARLAVVIGLNVNMDAAGPFKVKIKCFRRIPGYYPTSNLN